MMMQLHSNDDVVFADLNRDEWLFKNLIYLHARCF